MMNDVNENTVRDEDDEAESGYSVGYGKPPQASRFRPGQSGNPKGKPKKAKTIQDLASKMQSRKITITENGKTKKVSVLEAMLQRQISKALNGDNASFRIITTMIAAAEVNPDSSQALEPS